MLKGSLYHHIRSKEDLLTEVILDTLRSAEANLLAGKSAILDGRSIQRRLEAHFEYLSRQQAGLAFLLREAEQLPRPRRELIRNRVNRYEERLAQVLQAGQCHGAVTSGDPIVMVQLGLGACPGPMAWIGSPKREPH